MGVKRTCEVCEASDTLVCSACHTSHYCSSDHRRRHWDAHKINCRPMIERQDPLAGRFMVTSRDVVAGELLLTETPIALGPGATSPLICLGCHQYITGTEFPRCSSCWWPLCSPACASSSLHQAECPILAVDAKRIGQPKAPGSTPRYDIILVLRCLLLRGTDPSAWRRLLDMASHSQRRVQEGDQHHVATTQYIKDVLKVDYDLEDIQHVRDVIITNCFEWRSPLGVCLRGVYPLLARMNHSCRPNVALSSECDGTMYVRAATDLQGGDQLYVTYTITTEPLWERRTYTKHIHYFTCDCVRCADPTELGLHFSSPRCEHCHNQYLEATTWLGEVTWECPWCGSQKLEMVIRLEVEQWLARFESDDTFLNTGPRAIRNILEKVEEAFHPQHYVWMRAAQVAVKALWMDRSRDAAVLRRDLWARLLKIYSVLEPGLSRRRGVTLYEAGVAQAVLTRVERDAGVLTDHFFKLQLRQSLEHLQEAMRVLSLEPERSRERRWHQRASEAAAEVARELGVALPPTPSPPLVVAKDKPLQKRNVQNRVTHINPP
ncbi:SET domain-containing protein SmydA-8-like isoform X1 [Panulirus ornatus]|uniref:SET domain-containing protein SmydA-8-like isoform X1 n=1 Tax=Panulirus ornatus TaxID=150431 RepID=UPI003A87A035